MQTSDCPFPVLCMNSENEKPGFQGL